MDPNYGSRYRELYEKHWWWRAREEIICGEIRRRLPDNSRVSILDIGCGDGLFFERLREFGDVEGVEPAADLVDPHGPNRDRISVAPFDEGFQPRKQYDLILMLDVLEHLEAPAKALNHAVSLLTREGIIVATVPAFRLLWTNHDRLNRHRTRFTKGNLIALARSAGIEVAEARYFFSWLFAAKLVLRTAEAIARKKPSIPRIPPEPLNRFLHKISRAEEEWTRTMGVPFGSSLILVGGRSHED